MVAQLGVASSSATIGRSCGRERYRIYAVEIRMKISSIGLLLWLVSAAALGESIADRTEHASKLTRYDGRISELEAYAAAGATDRLVDAGQVTLTDSTLDIDVREALLHQTLMGLARVRESVPARQFVSGLMQRRPLVFAVVDEEHPSLTVPLYDIAASAAFTLRVWDRDAASRQLSAAMQGSAWQPASYVTAPANMHLVDWQAATRDALSTLDNASVAALKPALLAAFAARDEVDSLVLAAAEQTGDRELFTAVLQSGSSRTAIQAIESVNAALSAEAAIALLQTASARADVASAAILAIGTRVGERPELLDWLFARLGDRRLGGSAALALARVQDPLVIARCDSLVDVGLSTLAAQRLALVYRLHDAPIPPRLQEQLP